MLRGRDRLVKSLVEKITEMISKSSDRDPEKMAQDVASAVNQSAILAITDPTGKVMYANEQFLSMSKYEAHELIGKNHNVVNSGHHSKEFFKNMWKSIGSGNIWRGEIKNKAKDGTYYWVDTVIVPFMNSKGKPIQYISIRWDITEKKQMEESIRDNAELYRLITENASEFIAVIDYESKFKYASPSFRKLLGYPSERLEHTDFSDIIYESDRTNTLRNVVRYAKSQRVLQFRVLKSDNTVAYMRANLYQIQDEGKYFGDHIIVMHDITEQRISEQRILDLASNDQLTTLLNRTAFRRHLYKKLEHTIANEQYLALVHLNIDRFRYVNDSLGHQAGDYLLSVVANRLKEVLKEDIIGRISGDEFAFTLSHIQNEDDAMQVAEGIRLYLQEPIAIDDNEYELSISSGMSLFPEHATKAAELVTRAEKALQKVKVEGGGSLALYEPGTMSKTLERILLENELKRSVEQEYFELEYQPKVDLETLELTGFEALVRWNHPDLGRIPPDRFIPLAEETKVIVPLGEWILNEALAQLHEWEESGHANLRMAVNFSTIQIEEDNIVETIAQALQNHHISPTQLEVELTESTFVNKDEMSEKIQQIRDLGATVAIDDFGTGYSSFSYIKELPVDTVKIDRAFIRDLDENEDSKAIVSAIVTLANTVGLNIVAEGVETKQHGEILTSLGCHEGQGYYYSRPIAPTECIFFLENRIVGIQ